MPHLFHHHLLGSISYELSRADDSDLVEDTPDYEEDLDGRAAKRRRIECIASQYLRGKAPVIMSASLRGPFDQGWKNPWANIRTDSHAHPIHRTKTSAQDTSDKPNKPRARRPAQEQYAKSKVNERLAGVLKESVEDHSPWEDQFVSPDILKVDLDEAAEDMPRMATGKLQNDGPVKSRKSSSSREKGGVGGVGGDTGTWLKKPQMHPSGQAIDIGDGDVLDMRDSPSRQPRRRVSQREKANDDRRDSAGLDPTREVVDETLRMTSIKGPPGITTNSPRRAIASPGSQFTPINVPRRNATAGSLTSAEYSTPAVLTHEQPDGVIVTSITIDLANTADMAILEGHRSAKRLSLFAAKQMLGGSRPRTTASTSPDEASEFGVTMSEAAAATEHHHIAKVLSQSATKEASTSLKQNSSSSAKTGQRHSTEKCVLPRSRTPAEQEHGAVPGTALSSHAQMVSSTPASSRSFAYRKAENKKSGYRIMLRNRKPRMMLFESSPAVRPQEAQKSAEKQDRERESNDQCDAVLPPGSRSASSTVDAERMNEHWDTEAETSRALSTQAAIAKAQSEFQEGDTIMDEICGLRETSAGFMPGTPYRGPDQSAITPFRVFHSLTKPNQTEEVLMTSRPPMFSTQELFNAASPFAFSTTRRKTKENRTQSSQQEDSMFLDWSATKRKPLSERNGRPPDLRTSFLEPELSPSEKPVLLAMNMPLSQSSHC